MPSRNIVKIDIENSYYHVYARGAARKEIFLDDEDYCVFLNLLKRYLDSEPAVDVLGREYNNFYETVELLAFCLMPNHFHILLYQHKEKAITNLMRGLMSSYSRYFNKKYDRSGKLTESSYKSSRISNNEYLMHISRYIHLNPRQWRNWGWSSLLDYLDTPRANWVRPRRILEMFPSAKEYEEFVEDYEDAQRYLDVIKWELADR
jgi:putative transposase